MATRTGRWTHLLRRVTRESGGGLPAVAAALAFLVVGTLFLLLVIYGVLPVAGSGPGSVSAAQKERYRAAADRVNPPVVSYYRFEQSHLLGWSFLYALDFFRSQARGRADVSFDALELGREMAPRFSYRASEVVVTREGPGGQTVSQTTEVQLLTRADTYRGIYVYRYKRVTGTQTAADGTVTVISREVPAGVDYKEDWHRLDDVLARELGNGAATPDDRLMVLTAADAFAGGRSDLDWLAQELGAPAAPPEASGVPAAYLPYFRAAAAKYGVPWNVLAAIARVESDFDPYAVGPPNYTGELAQGMMQILPSTWAAYAVKAYGTGSPDPFDAADSIFTAAHLLATDGAAQNLAGAIFLYNHSRSYVQEVLTLAGQIGREAP